MQPDAQIRDEAAHWAVRTGDPAFDDWDGFTLWLERDPAHSAAYDAVMLAVEDAVEDQRVPATPPAPANDEDAVPLSAWRRRWFTPALAACLAGLAVVGVWQGQGGPESHVTAPGEIRTIALGSGDSAVLAGGSRLSYDPDRPRAARLEAGQALFRIRHDEAQPFRLVAGKDVLVDAGTTFDVRLGKQRLDVEVAEGAVIVNPDSRDLWLDAGARLTRVADEYHVSAISPSEVGEWRAGRITFRDATLAQIADDLSRATGVSFAARTDDTAQLSGSVLAAPIARDPQALASLLGVAVEREGAVWVISAN